MDDEAMSLDDAAPRVPVRYCTCKVPLFSIDSSTCSGCGLPEKLEARRG